MSQNNIQSDSVQNRRVTWEGCSVLLDINDGDRLVFARLTAGSTLKIGNKNYSLRALIGCPFGSSSQIEIGTKGPYLSRFIPSTEGIVLDPVFNWFIIVDECRDNRAIVDNNEAQTLTSEDIDEMRRQGAKGDEIIEALIANSATFEKKTAFSQEKYRIKKQKKYAPRVLLSICEAYFKKYPNRIGYLVLMEEDITSLSCFQDIGSPRYKMTIRSTNGPLVCVSLEYSMQRARCSVVFRLLIIIGSQQMIQSAFQNCGLIVSLKTLFDSLSSGF
ncbi:hypothetical protein NC652_014879 [Populus alba x Populus x berolinensis]|nr:hypothetical protein NC652_014879 [Populus alba x Populus x berolinensis]